MSLGLIIFITLRLFLSLLDYLYWSWIIDVTLDYLLMNLITLPLTVYYEAI